MEIECSGWLHHFVDGVIVCAFESASTSLHVCAHTIARLTNGAAALLLHYTVEPGYIHARRTRIAVDAEGDADGFPGNGAHGQRASRARGREDEASVSGRSGENRVAALQANENLRARAASSLLGSRAAVAFSHPPTSADAYARGLFREALITTTVAIDAVAAHTRAWVAHAFGARVVRWHGADVPRRRLQRRVFACVCAPLSGCPRLRSGTHAADDGFSSDDDSSIMDDYETQSGRPASRGLCGCSGVSRVCARVCARIRTATRADLAYRPSFLLSRSQVALRKAGRIDAASPTDGTRSERSSHNHTHAHTHTHEESGHDDGDRASVTSTSSDVPPDAAPFYRPMPSLGASSSACRIARELCGHSVCTYAVTAVDGYILTLIRIPRVDSSKVVLLQHGLLDSASAWLSTGNLFSLAARAHAAGYDVFLGNLRGSNDALGVNGFGANPVDYGELMEKEEAAAEPGLRGVLARLRTSSVDTGEDQLPPGPALPGVRGTVTGPDAPRGRSQLGDVIGMSQDGVPVHATLHPRQREYWNFHAQDHALDMMAFVRQIRIIKALEGKRRRRMQAKASAAAASTASTPSAASSDDGEPASPRSSNSTERFVDATSPLADDIKLVLVGHSMGGCVILLYLLMTRALRRPSWVDRAVLLSPAGLHNSVNPLLSAILYGMFYTGSIDAPAPFPVRSSTVQRFAARLLQDVKNSSASGDLMASLGSWFFGGVRHKFVFRYLAISEYPIGGTSTRVIKQGVQTMLRRDFCAYSYSKQENEDRYGSATSPSYRGDFGLYNVPIDFIAGGRDTIVPATNVEQQFALLSAVNPGLATLKTFDDAGHLDFSLTLADDIISYVLWRLEIGAGASAASSSERDRTAELLERYGLVEVAEQARQRHARIGAALTAGWQSAWECVKDYPWLGGFSKRDIVLDGLDAEARDMGLAPCS